MLRAIEAAACAEVGAKVELTTAKVDTRYSMIFHTDDGFDWTYLREPDSYLSPWRVITKFKEQYWAWYTTQLGENLGRSNAQEL